MLPLAGYDKDRIIFVVRIMQLALVGIKGVTGSTIVKLARIVQVVDIRYNVTTRSALGVRVGRGSGLNIFMCVVRYSVRHKWVGGGGVEKADTGRRRVL